jgi:hypothetical protein
MTRTAQTIIDEVMSRNGIWDAYDQGRWAFHLGAPISPNPHFHPALGFHVNVSDWERGWKAERDETFSAARIYR